MMVTWTLADAGECTDVLATHDPVNTRLEQLPDKFVAQWLNYTPAELYKVAEADKQDVEIQFRMAG